MLTDRLNELDRAALTTHLLALSPADRRVRFGYAPRDASIRRYAQDIDFNQDAVFGVRGDDRTIDGLMHVALEKAHAEIALSVLSPVRRRGIGSALLSRATTYASRHGIDTLYMQGLRENCATIRIAQSLGIKVLTDVPDTIDAKPTRVKPPAAATEAADATISAFYLYDTALRDALEAPVPNRVLQRTWQHINQVRTAS